MRNFLLECLSEKSGTSYLIPKSVLSKRLSMMMMMILGTVKITIIITIIIVVNLK